MGQPALPGLRALRGLPGLPGHRVIRGRAAILDLLDLQVQLGLREILV